MTDRLPSEHPSIETVRAKVVRHGSRYRLALNAPVLPEGSIARLVLDGNTRFASIASDSDEEGGWIIGVYVTPTYARERPSGADLLGPWLAERELGAGASVHLDVIEPGFAYGLREPGTRTIYEAVDPPPSSLSAIANRLEDAESS